MGSTVQVKIQASTTNKLVDVCIQAVIVSPYHCNGLVSPHQNDGFPSSRLGLSWHGMILGLSRKKHETRGSAEQQT